MNDFMTGATVSVGLDVHGASIRLAAVCAEELLDERTLPYDLEAVERALGRWPGRARLSSVLWRMVQRERSSYRDSAGFTPMRRAISSHFQ